ncbi:Hypothetical_protein [Hexamita inflata]|uniref:Hypothetical_protein n=2 Tax=Hexamita inflata TaxID=28002 RepID=A0AA86PZN8_9EUKA|nr:Hypothetical protein HINF_LOCUS36711 [Hexamita inflata]
MNIYQQVASDLSQFQLLREELKDQAAPLEIHAAVGFNHEVQDVRFIQTKLERIREEQHRERMESIRSSNRTHLSNESFKWYMDSVLKKSLQYLEPFIPLEDLEYRLDFEQFYGVFQAIKFWKLENERQLQVVRFLFVKFQPMTISNMLTLLQSIVLFPLRNSNSEHIQKLVKQNYEQITLLQPHKAQLMDLTSNNISAAPKARYDPRKKEESNMEEVRDHPDIEINHDMVQKKYEKLKQELEEYGIQADTNTFYDRVLASKQLHQAKLERQRQQNLLDEQASLTFKPIVPKKNIDMLSSSKRAEKFKDNQLMHYGDDIDSNPDPAVYTFHPRIGKSPDKNVFKPVPLPKGFNFVVNRLKDGYKERLRTKDMIENMGKYDPKKMEQLQKPLSEVEVKLNEKSTKNYQVYRRDPLKVAEVDVKVGKRATIKFYVGDSIQQHVQGLTKMFQLNQDQQVKLRKQLEKQFNEFLPEQICLKRSQQAYNSKVEEYDPLFDSEVGEHRDLQLSYYQQVDDAYTSVVRSGIQEPIIVKESKTRIDQDDPFFM